eukprot:7245708-Prymnesium_polylepis.1
MPIKGMHRRNWSDLRSNVVLACARFVHNLMPPRAEYLSNSLLQTTRLRALVMLEPVCRRRRSPLHGPLRHAQCRVFHIILPVADRYLRQQCAEPTNTRGRMTHLAHRGPSDSRRLTAER